MWIPYTRGSPIVFITLVGPNARIRNLAALVDSGADAACFPIILAESVFGLKRRDAKKGECQGIGKDKVPTWKWPQSRFSLEWQGVEIPLPNLDFLEITQSLLGRLDFFGAFRVSFDQPNEQMYISSDHGRPWPQ